MTIMPSALPKPAWLDEETQSLMDQTIPPTGARKNSQLRMTAAK
jgi:hypothetical protein